MLTRKELILVVKRLVTDWRNTFIHLSWHRTPLRYDDDSLKDLIKVLDDNLSIINWIDFNECELEYLVTHACKYNAINLVGYLVNKNVFNTSDWSNINQAIKWTKLSGHKDLEEFLKRKRNDMESRLMLRSKYSNSSNNL